MEGFRDNDNNHDKPVKGFGIDDNNNDKPVEGFGAPEVGDELPGQESPLGKQALASFWYFGGGDIPGICYSDIACDIIRRVLRHDMM